MKTRLATALLLTALLTGCATAAPNGPSPGLGGNKVAIVDPATGKVLPNQPVEPLNGVTFKPLTQGAAQYLSNNGQNQGQSGSAPRSEGAMTAPSVSGSAGDAAVSTGTKMGTSTPGMAPAPSGPNAATGGAFSGNVWSNYGFGYYFGGGNGFDQMALVSAQEAEAPGSAGSFQAVITGVTSPVVKDWAPDARLTESSAILTGGGQPYIEKSPAGDMATGQMGIGMPMPGYGYGGAQEGWRLVYVSTARQEMLTFAVTPSKTTIIRLRWAPLDLAPERVKIDSATAVKSLLGAIQDKGFQSEEEKSKKDYFMGYGFEQPQTGQWDGENQKTEVLYQVPSDARWNVSLQQVMGKLVWQINWWAPYVDQNGTDGGMVMPMPASSNNPNTPLAACPAPIKQTNKWVNNNGQGMIDAETGTVIRFSRPTQTTNTYEYQPRPCYGNGEMTPPPMPETTTPPTPKPADDQAAS